MHGMLRFVLFGVLFWGVLTGVLWNVVVHFMLGWPWPTGGVLAMNLVMWPGGGALWGLWMHRSLARARAAKSASLIS